jgi:hypothetical protein
MEHTMTVVGRPAKQAAAMRDRRSLLQVTNIAPSVARPRPIAASQHQHAHVRPHPTATGALPIARLRPIATAIEQIAATMTTIRAPTRSAQPLHRTRRLGQRRDSALTIAGQSDQQMAIVMDRLGLKAMAPVMDHSDRGGNPSHMLNWRSPMQCPTFVTACLLPIKLEAPTVPIARETNPVLPHHRSAWPRQVTRALQRRSQMDSRTWKCMAHCADYLFFSLLKQK